MLYFMNTQKSDFLPNFLLWINGSIQISDKKFIGRNCVKQMAGLIYFLFKF